MTVSRRRRHSLVIVLLVVVLVGGRATPAGAFLSALDPAGWAVVAQMAAVISQAVAIKRQVENVRNTARSAFFGKLAPLTGKLMTIRRQIVDARSKASLDVIIPDTSVEMLPDELPPFNQPLEDCVANTFTGDCLLPERSIDPANFGVLTQAYRDRLNGPTIRTGPATRQLYNDNADELDRYVRQLHDYMEAELDAAEIERARDRALVESLMATVEDWTGCQTAPAAGGTLDATVDDRVPCVSNGGLGAEDPGGATGVSGTDGMMQDLAIQLEALETYQGGDASKNQTDTLQTKLLITLARLQAAHGEVAARESERAQETAAVQEAVRRRDIGLLKEELGCRAAHPYSYWKPADINGDPADGECHRFQDQADAAIAALATSNITLLP